MRCTSHRFPGFLRRIRFSLLIRSFGAGPAAGAACAPPESEPMSNKGNMAVVVVVGLVAVGMLFAALQLG